MEEAKILKAYAKGFDAGLLMRMQEKQRQQLIIATEDNSVFRAFHYHNIVIKPNVSNDIKPMSYEQLRNAPPIIQHLYFCALKNQHVGFDQIKEANEKYPNYFNR